VFRCVHRNSGGHLRSNADELTCTETESIISSRTGKRVSGFKREIVINQSDKEKVMLSAYHG